MEERPQGDSILNLNHRNAHSFEYEKENHSLLKEGSDAYGYYHQKSVVVSRMIWERGESLERRVRGNPHARCGAGEKLEIISKAYLSLFIGTISLKEICNDRKKFGDEVQSKAQTDMSALGIEIISCNIQRVTDENSLINSLGQDNMSKIQKDAAIAKAEAERDVAIAQAQAAKASNDAKVEAEMQIAQKQNDLSIRKAELKVQEDTKKAEADAAYKIQEQEQNRSIETATVNAQIAKAEREAELKNREVEVKKNALDAEVRAQADADLYRRQKEAEAQIFERQKEAEARKAEADAVKYTREQEAAGIAAVGAAEADVIKAKSIAEAEGIDKKAEAMKKYGEAAIVEMVMNALPEIAKNVAEPLSKVDKITMYGEGNSAKLLGDIVNGTTQVTEGIASGLGLDIRALLAGALGGRLVGSANTGTENSVAQVQVREKKKRDFSCEYEEEECP